MLCCRALAPQRLPPWFVLLLLLHILLLPLPASPASHKPAEGSCLAAGGQECSPAAAAAPALPPWQDPAASSNLRQLWSTPLWSGQLELPAVDQAEMVRIITTQYFALNESLSRGDFGESSPPQRCHPLSSCGASLLMARSGSHARPPA